MCDHCNIKNCAVLDKSKCVVNYLWKEDNIRRLVGGDNVDLLALARYPGRN